MCGKALGHWAASRRGTCFFFCASPGKVTEAVGSCPCRDYSFSLFQIYLKQRFLTKRSDEAFRCGVTFGLYALLSYQHQYVACGCTGPGGELCAVSPALSTIWESPLTGCSIHSGCCPQFDSCARAFLLPCWSL